MVARENVFRVFFLFHLIFWLPVFHLIYDIWHESIGITIYSMKFLTDVVEFFLQISLIGTYFVSTVINWWKSATFPLNQGKGIPMYIPASMSFVLSFCLLRNNYPWIKFSFSNCCYLYVICMCEWKLFNTGNAEFTDC